MCVLNQNKSRFEAINCFHRFVDMLTFKLKQTKKSLICRTCRTNVIRQSWIAKTIITNKKDVYLVKRDVLPYRHWFQSIYNGNINLASSLIASLIGFAAVLPFTSTAPRRTSQKIDFKAKLCSCLCMRCLLSVFVPNVWRCWKYLATNKNKNVG